MSELDYILKQKVLYKSLKPCYCKAIQDTVHFTSSGLNHILYNRRRPRNLKEKTYRAALINYILEVVKDATTATKKIDTNSSKDIFWILEHEVKALHKGKKQIIKVILQKRGASSIQFLSIMSKRKC